MAGLRVAWRVGLRRVRPHRGAGQLFDKLIRGHLHGCCCRDALSGWQASASLTTLLREIVHPLAAMQAGPETENGEFLHNSWNARWYWIWFCFICCPNSKGSRLSYYWCCHLTIQL